MNEARRRTSWAWWLAVAVLWGLIAAILYPVFKQPGGTVTGSGQCLNNLHQIGLALGSYKSDWHDRLPPVLPDQSVPEGKAWPDFFKVYVRTEGVFRCPGSWPGCLTYSYNRLASGLHAKHEVASPSEVPLVFDSVNDSPENNNLNGDAAWHPSYGGIPRVGSLVFWPDEKVTRRWPKWAEPRHGGTTNVLYFDGHAKRAPTPDSARFDPARPNE